MTGHALARDFVTDMAARRAELTPDAIAFRDFETGAEMSFAAVDDRANRLARALSALGVKEGDPVAILCLNRPDFFVALFAAQKARLVLVPLNWRQPAAELAPILADAGARILIHDGAFMETVEALADASPLTRIAMADGVPADHGLDALIAAQPSGPVGDGRIPSDAVWYLLYTSGTTGLPKAVIQTPRMAWANAINFGQATDLVSTDTTVNYLPLFHTAGINLMTLPLFLLGGTSIVLRKFEVDVVVDLIASGDVTAFFGVPAIYQAISLHERFTGLDFSHVRSFGCGGAPIPVALLEAFMARGATICNGMGMTETGPTVFLTDPAHARAKIGMVGKAQMLSEVRIVDAGEAPIEGPGEGELQIRGPNVTPGYLGNDKATRAAFTDDGWLRTGDVARRDEDGYYAIVDRIKDMYISGGENVYPAEVERVLVAHEAVLEAAVVGVADETWGETGEAYLLLRPGATLDTDTLRPWCRERLAAYKVPRAFHLVDDFPRTAAGKVQKHVLKGQPT